MKNVLLYLSAFMPMYFLIFIKHLLDIINGKIERNILSIIVCVSLLCALALGALGLFLEMFKRKDSERKVIIITKTNITDEHFLGYFSLFVLFSISFDLSKVSMFVVFVVVLIMIGIVYVKNKLFYINPLLNILGYNFYDVSYKICGQEKEEQTKIFFKGNLVDNEQYLMKIKDENFAFLDDGR